MKNSWISSLLEIIILVIGIYGWVLNIYKLVKLDFEPPYKTEIIRIIGIPVSIVGSVIGYINFETK